MLLRCKESTANLTKEIASACTRLQAAGSVKKIVMLVLVVNTVFAVESLG